MTAAALWIRTGKRLHRRARVVVLPRFQNVVGVHPPPLALEATALDHSPRSAAGVLTRTGHLCHPLVVGGRVSCCVGPEILRRSTYVPWRGSIRQELRREMFLFRSRWRRLLDTRVWACSLPLCVIRTAVHPTRHTKYPCSRLFFGSGRSRTFLGTTASQYLRRSAAYSRKFHSSKAAEKERGWYLN